MTIGQGLYGLPEPQLPPRPPSRWRKPIRIVLCVGCFVIASLATLYFIGGSSPKLKTTVEEYLSKSSGYKVTIGKLNALIFYPLIGIDMDDVTYKSSETGVIAHFQHINFSTSFWGMSSGRSIHTTNIRDGFFEPGIITPGKLNIDYLLIDKDKKLPKPQLRFSGHYNNKPVTLTLGLEKYVGLLGGVAFGIADPAPFSLKAGEMTLEGHLQQMEDGKKIVIEKFQASPASKPVSGDMVISLPEKGFGLQGGLNVDGNAMTYDVNILQQGSQRQITGHTKADHFETSALSSPGMLVDDFKAIHDFYWGSVKDTAVTTIAVDAMIGGVATKVTLDKNALAFTPPLQSVRTIMLDK